MNYKQALKDLENRSNMIDAILTHSVNKTSLYGNDLRYYRKDLILLNNVELSDILNNYNKMLAIE